MSPFLFAFFLSLFLSFSLSILRVARWCRHQRRRVSTLHALNTSLSGKPADTTKATSIQLVAIKRSFFVFLSLSSHLLLSLSFLFLSHLLSPPAGIRIPREKERQTHLVSWAGWEERRENLTSQLVLIDTTGFRSIHVTNQVSRLHQWRLWAHKRSLNTDPGCEKHAGGEGRWGCRVEKPVMRATKRADGSNCLTRAKFIHFGQRMQLLARLHSQIPAILITWLVRM